MWYRADRFYHMPEDVSVLISELADLKQEKADIDYEIAQVQKELSTKKGKKLTHEEALDLTI